MTTPQRARSFGAAAAAYDRHRPSYPDAAVAWALGPTPGRDLLDLAAGTGKLTASLVARPGAVVVAVEPDPAMLDVLRARLPGVDARAGSAEALPLPDAAVDAVLVGQAWHWFDPQRALPEVGRVLRPGGVLACLWNGDDTRVEWVEGFHRAGAWTRAGCTGDDRPRLFDHPAFGPEEQARFDNPVPRTVDGLLATLATQSWALTAEPAERDAALTRVRTYLAGRPETSRGEFALPLVTECVRALRR